MNSLKFQSCVKSTLNYTVNMLAETLAVGYLDLDSVEMESELARSDSPALTWRLNSMSETPRDPLWEVDFDIGGKTTLDPSQYQSFDLISEIGDLFKVGASLDIFDYTGDSISAIKVGVLVVSQTTLMPLHHEKASGIRMVNITCAALNLSLTV